MRKEAALQTLLNGRRNASDSINQPATRFVTFVTFGSGPLSR